MILIVKITTHRVGVGAPTQRVIPQVRVRVRAHVRASDSISKRFRARMDFRLNFQAFLHLTRNRLRSGDLFLHLTLLRGRVFKNEHSHISVRPRSYLYTPSGRE